MNPFQKEVAGSYITGSWFGFYTKEEIVKLSVKQITNPIAIDELGTYLKDGLYDPVFGPQNPWDVCDTCGLVHEYCPGHPGHIELATPVYHPILFNIFYKLLRSVCFHCHRLRMKESSIRSYAVRFKLLAMGRLKEAIEYLNAGDIGFITKAFDLDELDGFTENVDTRKLKISGDHKRKKSNKNKSLNDAITGLVDYDSLVSNVVAEKKELLRHFFAEANATRKCPHCSA